MKIEKVFYKIKNEYGINKRVVVLADIHYYQKKNITKLNKLLKDLPEINPDYFCIPGDITDMKYIKDEQVLIEWVKKLSVIAPVIITLGNHEYYNKKDCSTYNEDLFDKFNRIKNVYFLDNNSVKIDGINFIGASLSGEYYYKYREKKAEYLINDINNNINSQFNGFNVLLCHSPIELFENFDKINILKYIDLVISGHTHGGLVLHKLKPVMNGRGIYSPPNNLFSRKCYGKYKLGNAYGIISSGITKMSYSNHFEFLDFLFKPEITIIDIFI